MTAKEIQLTNGGQLLTSSSSTASAGNIDINSEKFTISGYAIQQNGIYETQDISLLNPVIERIPLSQRITLNQYHVKDVISEMLLLTPNPHVALSNLFPHISTGPIDSNYIYKVKVPARGVRGIFDIDAGSIADVFEYHAAGYFLRSVQTGTRLRIFDSNFNLLAVDRGVDTTRLDPDSVTDKLGSSLGYTFREAGSYFILPTSSYATTTRTQFSGGGSFTEEVVSTGYTGYTGHTYPGSLDNINRGFSITLGTPKLFEQKPDGTQVSGIYAQTTASGNAGNININSSNITLANQGEIVADSSNSGTTGNITLAPTLNQNLLTINLQNGNISAATSGTSPGGNLILTAPESINITGNGTLSAQTSGAGRAGTVEITTNQLNLDSGTNITTTATSTSTTTEPGGSITLTANQMNLLGNIAILAETQGNTPAGSLTLQPNNSNTLNINLADNSRVSASTSSSGTGGSLIITAPDTINISGPGTLSAETSGTGKAGDILIQTQNLNLSNNTQISTSTTASGQGGNLRIEAPTSINLSNQAQLISQSTASGKAGNISLTSNNISLSNSKAAVNSQGTGNGGDINLTAQNLQLKQGSQLTASTASGEGGNLNLSVSDILLMRQNSRIETNAAGNGNGGDINLNNSSGFIVSVPNENSDITANAIAGNGGTINLSTSGLFGIQIRPTLTSQSDITASSDSGLQGTISVSNPNVDPSKGLNELPSVPTDGSNRIDNSCSAQSNTTKSGSSFILTGRGGLPTRPGSQSNTFNTGDIRDFSPQLAQQTTPVPQPNQPITEAQLSRTTPDGKVHLLAGRAITTPKPHCPDYN